MPSRKPTTLALITAALLAPVALVNSAAGDAIQLTGVIRDFKQSHPDMEYSPKSFGVRTGLVLPTLGADGKPVLNTNANYHNGMISSVESFNQWFRDVPSVNLSVTHAITLDNGRDTPGGVYRFAREKQLSGSLKYFFPMDGLGWNDFQNVSTGKHNFYFTYEIKTEFTFTPLAQRDIDGDGILGEATDDALVFSFTGDDDVWVFINGRLAVDIGGVHGQASKSVNLDTNMAALGLEYGHTYPLDFFFAERHTTESNFRIETTLQLVEVPPTTISPLYD
jgi:fibro-slime domain-containing protein